MLLTKIINLIIIFENNCVEIQKVVAELWKPGTARGQRLPLILYQTGNSTPP